MIEKLRVIFTIPELRRKIFLTIFLLAIYRVGWQIPLPIIDQQQVAAFSENMDSTVANFLAEGGDLQCQLVDQRDDFWAGNHALHFGFDYSSTAGHGLSAAGRTLKKGRRGRA